jgi:hypothetical protein
VDLQEQLRDLKNILCTVALSAEKDKPIWKWSKKWTVLCQINVQEYLQQWADRSFKHLWKAKIPLKIKIWLWLI